MSEKPRITIGIPCFQSVAPEVLQDYMRFAYYLGRRYEEYDFFLAIKTKSEQFRARNAIVEAALQVDSRYLLMLDDDHIIDWEDEPGPSERYDFIRSLVGIIQTQPQAGIAGCLYYTRGGDCKPVLMLEGANGGFFWIKEGEITGTVQEVAVQGGGCMLMDMNIFSKIPYPWFEPELELGTDLQICKKAREYGFKVYSDTSIVLGHVMAKQEIVTPRNRHRIQSESLTVSNNQEGIRKEWEIESTLNLYLMDAEEYMGIPVEKMAELADDYRKGWQKFDEYPVDDKTGWYRDIGEAQLARQVCFHLTDAMRNQFEIFTNIIDTSRPMRGLDYGCGSAPVGFEFALRGHHVDFIDIDGAYAYGFTKWRAKKRGIEGRCGWSMNGDKYDYALFMDSIEHLPNWAEVLTKTADALKPNGALITNYFLNADYENAEHISMDKEAVKELLVSKGIYPINELLWIKRDFNFREVKK